jgi:DNA polymerase I
VLEAELRVLDAGSDGRAALRDVVAALEVVDLAGAWDGPPGRTELLGVAVVADASAADVVWVPALLLGDLVELMAARGLPVRGHDVKPLMRSLLSVGVDLTGLALDTSIAAYLIDPADARYAIAEVLERYTEWRYPPDDPAAAGQLDFGDTAVGHHQRAARQALAVAHLAAPLTAALQAQGMEALYSEVENPLVRVLARMEHVGIAVDAGALRELNTRLTAEVQRLTEELHRVVGRPFNVNSPVQLREILYTERGLTPQKKTKTGLLHRCGHVGEAP